MAGDLLPMQQAEAILPQAAAEQAIPQRPGEDWQWSKNLKRWIEPGRSPLSGAIPPVEHRFKTGEASDFGHRGGIVSAALRAALVKNAHRIDNIVDKWITDAENGDNRARDQLLDRLEGKVEQAIHATIESRYVIEEIGVPFVESHSQPAGSRVLDMTQLPAEQALTSSASDNIHSVSLGDTGVLKAENGGPGSDPDAVTPPHSTGGPTPAPAPGEVE